jgi:hypothetical protein
VRRYEKPRGQDRDIKGRDRQPFKAQDCRTRVPLSRSDRIAALAGGVPGAEGAGPEHAKHESEVRWGMGECRRQRPLRDAIRDEASLHVGRGLVRRSPVRQGGRSLR